MTMAGCLDEFDDATPLRNTFCSRLTLAEYEEQTANSTEEALAQLIKHLESNPQEYRKVLETKKKEEANVFSYIKAKLFSYFSTSGANDLEVSDEECSERLEKLKENIIKSYNYSQESRGRRFSKRLVDRRVQQEVMGFATPTRATVPPPPPLPPSFNPPPTSKPHTDCSTPLVHATLTRRPLSTRQPKTCQKRQSRDSGSIQSLITQLRGSECKRKLRKVSKRSPGGTPVDGWPKPHKEPDMMPYFNAKLLDKFKNAHSPHPTSPTLTLASPGSFESPVATPTQLATSTGMRVSPTETVENHSPAKENIKV